SSSARPPVKSSQPRFTYVQRRLPSGTPTIIGAASAMGRDLSCRQQQRRSRSATTGRARNRLTANPENDRTMVRTRIEWRDARSTLRKCPGGVYADLASDGTIKGSEGRRDLERDREGPNRNPGDRVTLA